MLAIQIKNLNLICLEKPALKRIWSLLVYPFQNTRILSNALLCDITS